MPRLAVIAAAGLLAALPAVAASPVGRWTLVEQRYQDGPANLAFAERPVVLEVARDGASLDARIGAVPAPAVRWPAFVTDAGPIPVEVLERRLDEATGVLHARYRVRPSPEDDLILEIDESYRLADEGRALEGDMRVDFRGGTTDRGGFTLHRRFERTP